MLEAIHNAKTGIVTFRDLTPDEVELRRERGQRYVRPVSLRQLNEKVDALISEIKATKTGII